MTSQEYVENSVQKGSFWNDATKYTATFYDDKSFINEMAYMMVTLHRTGA